MGLLLPFGKHIQKGQTYGSNPFVGPNPAGGHNGDDWLTQIGEPVRAAGDFEVVFAGEFDSTYADNFGWNLNYGGKMVVLNIVGETSPYVEYGHLSEIYVVTGQKGKRGQVIAATGNTDGNTGVSSGPHCHVGVLPYNFNLNTNTYGRVNPSLYLTDYWEDEAGTISAQGTITETQEEIDLAAEQNIMARLEQIVEWTNQKFIEAEGREYFIRDTLAGFVRDVVNAKDSITAEELDAKLAALTAPKEPTAVLVKGDEEATVYAWDGDTGYRGLGYDEFALLMASGAELRIIPQSEINAGAK